MDAVEDPERVLRGRVTSPGHLLTGLWVMMCPRHANNDGYYNLFASPYQTVAPGRSAVGGYAQVEPR